MPAKKWLDREVSLDPIKKQTIAVIGYGIQGRAQASNMKDSGLNVIVGLRKGGKTWKQAEAEGHKVMEVANAAKAADIIHILIPDMEQEETYKRDIAKHVTAGKALSFSHGAAIHWKWIVPPKDVDVIMVAPKGPGQRVRELYQDGFGIPSLVAVHQDHTGRAWDRVLAMAKGIGSTRPGVLKTDFKEEVETDWFGEQVDLCGGTHALVMNAFETLVEAGYQPEVAYFECLHELKLITDLVQKYGLTGMYNRVSETARYGGLTRGPRVVDKDAKKKMKQVLNEIQSGEFADEWVSKYKKEGKNSFARYMKDIENHQIEKVGKDLRKMMWPEQET
ncbi:ketol-acid reductoisomerase [Nitrososphaera viennensis]|uniref:Ketol-acid reductoisomerase (NADP(+)) n=2 Tax=Nitrososphaera viennensis TaxID=1034015 RepID=A0A060HPS6_9ARCH|nr:ketol-acid reductoisomerase [Nitrososphaera viennensis]AIC17140.1 ketol-acid reductoisomerase [Nitrososphaera viennensis EN76]UVS69031.1 ketol-acid reductoisomerase [Nitrososphaera viennensis]